MQDWQKVLELGQGVIILPTTPGEVKNDLTQEQTVLNF